VGDKPTRAGAIQGLREFSNSHRQSYSMGIGGRNGIARPSLLFRVAKSFSRFER